MSRLHPPVGPGDHVAGDVNAKVTLVEYGDYECPYCGRAHRVVQEALRLAGPDVRFVFRHFPLAEAHPHALVAAEAAEAAGAQGQFWVMHDMLFENQDALAPEDLLAYAQAAGLDEVRFTRDLASHAYLARVQADFSSGVRSGVNGTPSFFVQGERLDAGWDLDTLVTALQEAPRESAEPRRRTG
jgi:protein-disulfide isomerase